MVWQESAACLGDPNTAWLGDTMTVDLAATCLSCPVRIECLTEALPRDRNSDNGVWGCTTPDERGRIRRHKARVADVWAAHSQTVKEMHGGRHDDMDYPSGLLSRERSRPGTRPGDRRADG